MPILKLDRESEDLEIAFELKYLRSLTQEESFQMMLKKTEELKGLMKNRGYRKTVEVIKRK